MKWLLPAAFVLLVACCASMAFAQQSATVNIPPDAVAKVQQALAHCNAQTGQPETATEFATRVVKEALEACYVQGERPNTVEFDETWPGERQP